VASEGAQIHVVTNDQITVARVKHKLKTARRQGGLMNQEEDRLSARETIRHVAASRCGNHRSDSLSADADPAQLREHPRGLTTRQLSYATGIDFATITPRMRRWQRAGWR
jgi:hypothetical protein